MTTLTAAATKEIKYSRLTKDYDMLLNGQYVGSAPSFHAAEVELDRLAYERLDRAGVEPELLLSTTALDGGSHPDEIAAEYAAALPVQPPCDFYKSPRWWRPTDHPCRNAAIYTDGATNFCLICHKSYPFTLIPGARDNLGPISAPFDKTAFNNLITPDPAECPDISAPQPCEDLSACPVARCANCDQSHHIQRCPEVWRALMG